MASGIRGKFSLDCTVKSEKLKTVSRLFGHCLLAGGSKGRAPRRLNPAAPGGDVPLDPRKSVAGKKFLDSSPVLFYDLHRISLRGGDPGESAALFHAFEILKHRRPGSLGKALDSEAGQGWG
jgi:hypothetical protein